MQQQKKYLGEHSGLSNFLRPLGAAERTFKLIKFFVHSFYFDERIIIHVYLKGICVQNELGTTVWIAFKRGKEVTDFSTVRGKAGSFGK